MSDLSSCSDSDSPLCPTLFSALSLAIPQKIEFSASITNSISLCECRSMPIIETSTPPPSSSSSASAPPFSEKCMVSLASYYYLVLYLSSEQVRRISLRS
jgi:hypothetical protein